MLEINFSHRYPQWLFTKSPMGGWKLTKNNCQLLAKVATAFQTGVAGVMIKVTKRQKCVGYTVYTQ